MADRMASNTSRKGELILKTGSHRVDVADEAVGGLRARGWLANGALRGTCLGRPNLQGADLRFAKMEKKADLTRTICDKDTKSSDGFTRPPSAGPGDQAQDEAT